ncbi:acetyltransferase (GNAT) family protein [Tumebacillus sp. BK434]|uniref:GNAT family N-acetyltransferase n=1 Tax=Tumebacillus sp. BK434 TaxID=2512169 RepID=UPI0010434D8A|nr:GNAT family N-acetyltransferase [Tumebacillus sp. BK434]TCP59313.1 acetyltransferase (GNAT) family protein [Tumebacillus sp. BK434]
MHNVQIRALEPADRSWLRDFLIEHWGSPQMVYSQGIHQLDELPGFVAWQEQVPVGLITFHRTADELEIVSLDSLREGHGIGSALIGAAEAAASEQSVRRVWLITTNDNLHALRFYQKRGYDLVQIYRNAVEKAREIKPQIPRIGNDGIIIQDEIELEKILRKE